MKNIEEQKFELPEGFRFHPTDEELITHYLSQKVLDSSFCAIAIGEVDFNKCEPWDLPWRAKMGEKEWYFFSVRDKKYPSGLRTNRATEAGYWKATGKDKEIFNKDNNKDLIGMKKTLVFYKGRAPKGQKSNWVMHEYRLEGKHSMHNLPKTAKKEWAVCRVFEKSEKKVQVLEGYFGKQLPPLMDSAAAADSSHVTCFSDPNNQTEDSFQTHFLLEPNTCNSWDITNSAPVVSHLSTQVTQQFGNSPPSRDADVIYNEVFQGSFGNQEYSSANVGHVDGGCCLWDF